MQAAHETRAEISPDLAVKLDALVTAMRQRGAVLVAYSGGVDSALVSAAALRAVGPWDPVSRRGALAVLADSTTLARRELASARETAAAIGVPLHEIRYSELENPDWVANGADRCYYCKKDLAEGLLALAPSLGLRADQIAFGITTSDLGDHRPGIQATREAGTWHPLVDAGLSKTDVRALARHLDVPVWDKPATPCLASRVQYGEPIDAAKLARVERAEDALLDLGFHVFRVRHHGALARVEVSSAELDGAFAKRDAITAALKAAGYTYVTLDLQGFRSGAMNEALPMWRGA